MVATASGGKRERSVLSLKRDRLFRGGARAVASRGLYLPVEGYWFSDSLHHTPQAAREQRETDELRKRERERKRASERDKKIRRKREKEREIERKTEKKRERRPRDREGAKQKRANRTSLPFIVLHRRIPTRARVHARLRQARMHTRASPPPPPPPPSSPYITIRRISPSRKQRVGTDGRQMNGTEGAERGTRIRHP